MQRAEVLDDRIGVLAAQIHALEAELVAVLKEHDAAGAWQGGGLRSHAQWISRRTKFTPGDAQRLALVVAQADRLPKLLEGARTGQVSVGLVAAAARIVNDTNESAVAQIVECCTPAQALRVLSSYRSVAPRAPDRSGDGSTDADRPGGEHRGEPDPSTRWGPGDLWWRHWTDHQGRHRVDAAMDPVTGALLEQARRAARAAAERASSDRLSHDDVTSALASTVLDSVNQAGTTDRGGERFSIQVTCDLATLAHALGLQLDDRCPVGLGSRAYLPSTGQHLADHQLARMACDGELQLLVEHQGVPLWLGATVRLFNRHQRRAMNHRANQGCEFPGCTQTRWVEAHHITPASHDGPTDLTNGVLLCSHHHHELHRRSWTITRHGTQFTFRDGQRSLGSTGPPGPAPGPPAHDAVLPTIVELPETPPGIGPHTPTSPGANDRLTHYGLDILVTTLLAA